MQLTAGQKAGKLLYLKPTFRNKNIKLRNIRKES